MSLGVNTWVCPPPYLACFLGKIQFQALVPCLAQGMARTWCREGALPGVQLLWVKVALLQPQQVLSSICFLRRFQAA